MKHWMCTSSVINSSVNPDMHSQEGTSPTHYPDRSCTLGNYSSAILFKLRILYFIQAEKDRKLQYGYWRNHCLSIRSGVTWAPWLYGLKQCYLGSHLKLQWRLNCINVKSLYSLPKKMVDFSRAETISHSYFMSPAKRSQVLCSTISSCSINIC